MSYSGSVRVGKFRPMFRAKEMGFQEWSRFLEAIDQAALEGAGQIPALLVRDVAEAEKSLVLLAGDQLEKFESASPSDWMDYPEAVEDRWIPGRRPLVGEETWSEARR